MTTAVNAGTLLVNGTLDPSGGAVSVAPGAAIGSTCTINLPITIAAGGILTPGASPGVLSANAPITLNPRSVFAVELNGPTPDNGPTNHDQLIMPGGNVIDLAGATLLPTIGGGSDPSLGVTASHSSAGGIPGRSATGRPWSSAGSRRRFSTRPPRWCCNSRPCRSRPTCCSRVPEWRGWCGGAGGGNGSSA